MKPKKIKAIVKEKADEIALLSAAVGKSFDKEAIHKFRVAVKNLRSFLRLQKMHTGDDKIRLPKKFKRLYDIAGAIREAQLEIDFFKDHEPGMLHYTEQLQQEITIHQKEWDRRYSEKVLHKLAKKLAGFKYKEMHPTQLAHFFTNRMEAISNIAHSSAPTDNDIHDARKNIKDMLYTSKLAEKKWKAAVKQVQAVPSEKLDALSDMIGNYNDERIMLEHVAALPAQGMAHEEKSTVKHFKGRTAKKLGKTKNSIISATRLLMNNDSD